MTPRFRSAPFFLLAAAAAVVLAYNLWSYCCGRCRLEHFFTLGLPGMVLILATGAAAGVLLLLRRLRRRQDNRRHCRCGTRLFPGWLFCPACGGQAAASR